jgi:hypothetical protein
MVASGSRTMIAGSLSSCVAGFRQSIQEPGALLRRRPECAEFVIYRFEGKPGSPSEIRGE